MAWAIAARARAAAALEGAGAVRHRKHPDRNQENLFFRLLAECLANGLVTEEMVREEMRQDHVRHDGLAVLASTPPLSQTLQALPPA